MGEHSTINKGWRTCWNGGGVGVEVGGSAQNLTKFQMVPIPILSVLTCSTSSSHDILKVKKTTNTCLVGGTNVTIVFRVGKFLDFGGFLTSVYYHNTSGRM